MSMIKWLMQNSGAFKHSTNYTYFASPEHPTVHTDSNDYGERAKYNGIYNGKYKANVSYSVYYTHAVDSASLANAIKSTKHPYEQRLAIALIDETSLQNAFHFVLSNQVYKYKADSTDATLLTEHLSKTTYSITKVTHRTIPINSDKKNYSCLYVDELKQYEENHKSLDVKSPIKRVEEQQPLLIDALLAPFADADAELVSALTATDKEGNTPLHYLWRKLLANVSYDNLLKRISILSEEDKEKIAFTVDKNGQNIFHVLAAESNSFFEKIFGEKILKKAFSLAEHTDRDGNMPLHIVCQLAREDRLDKVSFICEKLNSGMEEKSDVPASEVIFQQNAKHNQNPFHLACKVATKNLEADIKLIKQLQSICNDKDAYKSIILERDKDGNTALHYAIQSGNNDIVEILLKELNPTDKNKLAKIKNNKGETALHYACRYGTKKTLELIAGALGCVELYQIRKDSPNLNKLLTKISENDFNNTMLKYNNLINAIHYFFDEEKYFNKELFKLKFDDLLACIQCRIEGKPLPKESPKFLATSFLGIKGSEVYHKLRENFNKISLDEIEECRVYCNSNPHFEIHKNDLLRGVLSLSKKKPEEKPGDNVVKQILTPGADTLKPAESPSAPPAEPQLLLNSSATNSTSLIHQITPNMGKPNVSSMVEQEKMNSILSGKIDNLVYPSIRQEPDSSVVQPPAYDSLNSENNNNNNNINKLTNSL